MFYGLDVHKEFIQVCQLDAKGANPKEYRIGGSAEEIDRWAQGLGRRDQVVLEATFHTWAIHAIVSQYAGRVVVANALQVKAIAHAKIKTDKVDAHTLARLLHADFLPSVELPDEKTWAMRQLVSHRRLLVKQRVAIKNTVLATFHRCLIGPPEGDAFSARGRRWMRSVRLAPTERFLVDNGLDLLEAIEARLDAADQQLLKTAAIEEQAQLLMTIPGVGVTVAMGLLAAIGDSPRPDSWLPTLVWFRGSASLQGAATTEGSPRPARQTPAPWPSRPPTCSRAAPLPLRPPSIAFGERGATTSPSPHSPASLSCSSGTCSKTESPIAMRRSNRPAGSSARWFPSTNGLAPFVPRAPSRRSTGKQDYPCCLSPPKQNAGLPRTTGELAPD
jgi:transposase